MFRVAVLRDTPPERFVNLSFRDPFNLREARRSARRSRKETSDGATLSE